MFSEAAHAVTHPAHPSRSKKEDLRRHLQLASSLFCLGKYSSAVDRAIFILGLLGAPDDESSSASASSPPSVGTSPAKLFSCLPSEDPPATPGRLVQLLPCTDAAAAKGDLVSYCMEMIVTALKTRIFIAGRERGSVREGERRTHKHTHYVATVMGRRDLQSRSHI